jgi:prepilin-type processing-associated H-X9-DG protein
VRIAAVSNWGDPSQTGLAEVQVQGTPVAGRGPLPATIHSVSSDLGAPFSRRAAYLVNGAGMLFADGHTTIPDGFMWLTTGTLQAPNDLSPEVTFDLGEVVTIDRMKVWNYNEYRPDLPTRVNELLGRGVATADVLVAGEDLMFTTLYAGYEFNRAPTTLEPVDYHQVVPLGVEARYVKLRILSNHNGKDFTNPLSNDALGNHAGLSEVQFFGTSRPSADLNGDGRVDRRDVLAMMANYGRFPDATLEQGDLNDDGAVGLSDLYRMQRQLTDPPAAGAAAVPEPQALVLLLAGLAGGWVGARRRRFKGC